MDKKQQQLILELAKRIKQEKKNRTNSVRTLESAGIISTKGKGNKHYPNLDRVLKPAQMYNVRPNLILGFHGCDESVAEKLINSPKEVQKSKKPHDWLGHGMYFWENNLERAQQWAQDKEKRGEINKAAVVGAILTLDNCLDLLDSSSITLVSTYYDLLKDEFKATGKILPKNIDVKQDPHKDKLKRELDCAVIEYMHKQIELEITNNIEESGFSKMRKFDSSRGFFTEGGPAFPGSEIQIKSHSQICIRNMECIKGFFKPRS